MNVLRYILAPVAALAMAGQAQAAAPLALCAVTDITPNAEACAGWFAGNLNSNSPADVAATTAALLSLGLVYDGTWEEKLDGLNGSHTVDFATLLTGIVYVGFHHGNGQGGPGNGTAFYRLDAGAGLDQFTLFYNASSNAVLFANGVPRGVPEPATWAMMLLGFGAVGGAMRRRRRGTALQIA